MKPTPLNRRTFIKIGSTTVASFLIGCPEMGRAKRLSTGGSTDQRAQSVAPENAASSTEQNAISTATTECAPTSDDITGPYWRKGIPVRSEFDLYGHSGQKLTLSGSVRTEHCEPIANAVIEMWHATPTVAPANALSRADSVDYDMSSPKFRYYGQFATDAQGTYAMSTMKPGWYLNGAAFRPSHIHVRIYVDGVERLTTQLYFEGDPFIGADPWASAAPERAIALQSAEDGSLTGSFDFTV
ncbi:MAG: hypothetical protein VX519_10645 [Myxococcota bacterium]|nr:hypothetical protein [Myxococcota bacterium]